MVGRKAIISLLLMTLLVVTGPAQWIHHQSAHAHASGAAVLESLASLHAGDVPCGEDVQADNAHPAVPVSNEADCFQCHLLAHSHAISVEAPFLSCLRLDVSHDGPALASLHRPASAYLSDLGGRDPPASSMGC